MTDTAVGVGLQSRFPRAVLAVGRSRLMPMIVVPEVLRGDTLLVLAISARCCPDSLERQDENQEDK